MGNQSDDPPAFDTASKRHRRSLSALLKPHRHPKGKEAAEICTLLRRISYPRRKRLIGELHNCSKNWACTMA